MHTINKKLLKDLIVIFGKMPANPNFEVYKPLKDLRDCLKATEECELRVQRKKEKLSEALCV